MNISKKFHFNASHRLLDYEGLCGNVHGHNFKVVITVEVDESKIRRTGIDVDFKDLKSAKELINKHRDHAYLHHQDDEIGSLLAHTYGLKTYSFSQNPTTEILIFELYKLLQNDKLSSPWSKYITNIEIQETDSNKANSDFIPFTNILDSG